MTGSNHLGIAPSGVYEVVLDELRDIHGLRILDLPSASGGFAARLSTLGATCVAADRAPGRRHNVVAVADMNRTLPFSDRTFDVVTCLEGIEHSRNPSSLLCELHRVLRPGGRLLLSTPNIHNIRSRIKFALRGTLFWFDVREVTGVGHVTVLPYFVLKHFLMQAGFATPSVRINGTVSPSCPAWIAAVMQRLCSLPVDGEQELNSSPLLNGESLIWITQKPGVVPDQCVPSREHGGK